VCVKVIGNISHVVVNVKLGELRGGYLSDALEHVGQVLGRGSGAVEAPHNHGHVANIALGDPADLVLVIPRGDSSGTAQITPLNVEEGGGVARHAGLKPERETSCSGSDERVGTGPHHREV